MTVPRQVHVIDSSALLTFAFEEPGQERVRELLHDSCVSAVNWSETLQKSAQKGLDSDMVAEAFARAGVRVLDFTQEDAQAAAGLWQETRGLGLSLADRACLALGQRMGLPVATADRAWTQLPPFFKVELIRPG